MKIILSPAKKMNIDDDSPLQVTEPRLLERTRRLYAALRSMSLAELQRLWKCSDGLAELNYQRLQQLDFSRAVTPAVLAYEGLAYQHLAPRVLTDRACAYLEKNLRILSGFYGVLRPFDAVVPYRLELQAPLRPEGCKNLYQFWGSSLYEELVDEDRTIINLASEEYARAVRPFLQPGDRFLTVEFCEAVRGVLRQKGTYAKMARGAMVRFMAEGEIGLTELDRLKEFKELGFSYLPGRSTEECFVFVRGQSC